VTSENRFELSRTAPEFAQGMAIGVLRETAAIGVAEHVGEEDDGIVLRRFEQNDVGVRKLSRVTLHADPHARVDEGAERLRQHGEKSVIGETPGLRARARGEFGVERHDRIDADEQLHAGFERDRRVQRFLHCAVDIVVIADARRRIEAGQGCARLDGLRDRHIVEARRPERHRPSAVEVGRHNEEFARKLAKVVGPSRLAEQPREVRGDRVIVEQAVRQATREPHEGFEETAVRRNPKIGERRRLDHFRHAHEPPRKLGESGPQQQAGFERVLMRLIQDEHRMHLTRGETVGETRRHKGARAHADIDVALRELEALERLFKRDQRANFVNTAEGTAPREGDPHFAVATTSLHRSLQRWLRS